MTYNKLTVYKKHLRRELYFNSVFLIVGIIFLSFILWGAFSKPIALVCTPLPLAMVIPCFFELKNILHLLRELNGIAIEKTINKTHTVSLYRPHVRAMVRSRGRYSFSTECYGIRIIAPDKKKYYYFFDGLMLLDKEGWKRIEEKFYRDLTLQYYQGTNIIRTIENDPYFLRIGLRERID